MLQLIVIQGRSTQISLMQESEGKNQHDVLVSISTYKDGSNDNCDAGVDIQ